MRYESKSIKSQSLLINRENKENSDTTNFNQCKLKRDSINILKLQKKISQNTTSTLRKNVDYYQDIKKVYSTIIAEDYSNSIIQHITLKSKRVSGFLSNHSITSTLRAKMVDWMIQVLSSYKMTQQTFFRSVNMMDIYLKACSTKQQVKDLHLIGITCMFIASKYEEIHPFKLSVMYDKIGRRKFRKEEILDKQSQIINILNFSIEHVNVYDFVKHALNELQFNLELFSHRYLQQIALYLSKMSLFSSELVEQNLSNLAGAVIFISLKTLEQTDKSIEPQKKLTQISYFLSIQEENIIQLSRKVLELAKNFSKVYPNLNNLKRFNKFEYKSQ